MARSRVTRPASYQITIDDLDIGYEYIAGSVPAAEELADLARAKANEAWFNALDQQCIPDQMIHVYVESEKLCVCETRKRKVKK